MYGSLSPLHSPPAARREARRAREGGRGKSRASECAVCSVQRSQLEPRASPLPFPGSGSSSLVKSCPRCSLLLLAASAAAGRVQHNAVGRDLLCVMHVARCTTRLGPPWPQPWRPPAASCARASQCNVHRERLPPAPPCRPRRAGWYTASASASRTQHQRAAAPAAASCAQHQGGRTTPHFTEAAPAAASAACAASRWCARWQPSAGSPLPRARSHRSAAHSHSPAP